MTDLREVIARALYDHDWRDPEMPDWDQNPDAQEPYRDNASAALRAIADAGPTDATVEAAARLIARDFALSTSIGGAEAWSAERWPDFSDIARSALSAALKEMG